MGCCKKQGCCQSGAQDSYVSSDYLVCTCMGVLKSEIIAEIERGAYSFEELSDRLGVGTGCSSCVEEVHGLLVKYRDKRGC